jgi:hypothetical protein
MKHLFYIMSGRLALLDHLSKAPPTQIGKCNLAYADHRG